MTATARRGAAESADQGETPTSKRPASAATKARTPAKKESGTAKASLRRPPTAEPLGAQAADSLRTGRADAITPPAGVTNADHAAQGHPTGHGRGSGIGEFIREQRRISRLSVRRLSEMAQVSNPYLSQIERGLRRPSADILQQLAKALRISAETLYVQAGMLDEREPSGDLAVAIWADPTLTDQQKQALAQILRSFQSENAEAARRA